MIVVSLSDAPGMLASSPVLLSADIPLINSTAGVVNQAVPLRTSLTLNSIIKSTTLVVFLAHWMHGSGDGHLMEKETLRVYTTGYTTQSHVIN